MRKELSAKDVMRESVTQIEGIEIKRIGITERSVFIWLKTQITPITIFKDDLK